MSSPTSSSEKEQETEVPENVYFQLQCSVLKVDALSNTITFDTVLCFTWTPPISTQSENSINEFVKTKNVPSWQPDVNFFELKSKTVMEESFFFNKHSGAHACFLNWVLLVNETLELEHFPYDRQFLKIIVEIPGVKSIPCPSRSDTFVLPGSFPEDQMECFVEIGNWDIEDANLSLSSIGQGRASVSEITCEMQLTRDPTYYLWNIVLVLFVLILAAFSVVGIPFDELANRMGITMTLLLTIVAFKFVIATYVPPTPYLTLLDKYILAAFILIGLVVFENFLISFADADSLSAQRVDTSFAFILSILWICFHIFVIIGTHRSWFYLSWEAVRESDEATSQECMIGKSAADVIMSDNDDDSSTDRDRSGSSLRRRSSQKGNTDDVTEDESQPGVNI